ncbi:hypothetical protein ACMA1D_11800 [Streptomyces sp. 796.1]|uniref:hypothetical protein n=1 Tax=Streptomyces sp. 796.1 TaxID=3163029 RepID=UPI0039C9BCE0
MANRPEHPHECDVEAPAAIRAAATASVHYGIIGAPLHRRWEKAMTIAYALGATSDDIAAEARRVRFKAAAGTSRLFGHHAASK